MPTMRQQTPRTAHKTKTNLVTMKNIRASKGHHPSKEHPYLDSHIDSNDAPQPLVYFNNVMEQTTHHKELEWIHYDQTGCIKSSVLTKEYNKDQKPTTYSQDKYVGHRCKICTDEQSFAGQEEFQATSRRVGPMLPDPKTLEEAISNAGINPIELNTSNHNTPHRYSEKLNHSSNDERDTTEAGLAVASPVTESENNPTLYEAIEYDPSPEPKTFRTSWQCCKYTTLFSLVVCVVVATGIVLGSKLRSTVGSIAASDATQPNTDCESFELQDIIEKNVLERNGKFHEMESSDPRRLALDWILHEDQLRYKFNLFQRYILAVFAFSLDLFSWNCGVLNDLSSCNETDIDGSALWLSGTDECLWYGVLCGLNGVVESISLPSNYLIGVIPPEISGLRFLKGLSLSDNCLYGTVPSEIGKLTSLEEIDLEWNALSGPVVSQLYELPSLMRLKLAGNIYSGSCSRRDGSLVNITSTGLEGDLFSPSIAQLHNLKEVSVQKNNFSSSISSEIGTLYRLEKLSAGDNNLSGSLPQELTHLSGLKELWLGGGNNITGGIPNKIGDMDALVSISLWGLAMSGTIPDSLYTLANLKFLYLENNKPGFKGKIKTDIGNLVNLNELWLSDNPFLTGTLPSELGRCQDLVMIQMQNTQINGVVPKEVCNLRDKKLNLENAYTPEFFKADCLANNETLPPHFDCKCCSSCCDHTTTVCIDIDS